MADAQGIWQQLFDSEGASSRLVLNAREVLKQGRPFMLLPDNARAAALALDLYPAQTPRARLARTALRLGLRTGLKAGTRPVTLQIGQGDLARFMSKITGTSHLPVFAVLAGNPGAEGRRFVFLLFSADVEAAAAVKVGYNPAARALVQLEVKFLEAAAQRTKTVPKIIATSANPHFEALALPYYSGRTPIRADEGQLSGMLTGWLAQDRQIRIGDTAQWRAFSEAIPDDRPDLRAIASNLSAHQISSTIYHGDFVPWNIRVQADGQWRVLDWERGDLNGLPGWDWFHYTIQTMVLVQRLPTTTIRGRLGTLLRSQPFQDYARKAGICGCEHDLLRAYLHFCIAILQPSEGMHALRQLATELQ